MGFPQRRITQDGSASSYGLGIGSEGVNRSLGIWVQEVEILPGRCKQTSQPKRPQSTRHRSIGDENQTAEYQQYMNQRIAYACACKMKSGVVPDEATIDAVVPVPHDLAKLISDRSPEMVYLARKTKRDMAYGICGISQIEDVWVARTEKYKQVLVRQFHTALSASRWYNRMEARRGEFAVRTSLAAARLLDAGIIQWQHVSAIKRGREKPRPEIMKRLQRKVISQ